MKRTLVTSLIAASLWFASCDPVTGSSTYDAVWSPSADPQRSPWTFPAGIGFSQEDGGFQFTATVNDSMVMTGSKDSLLSYAFSPAIYQVTNIPNAKSAVVRFRADIVTASDSIALLPSGKASHQFATLGGWMSSSSDGVNFSVKPLIGGTTNAIALSVNPDSCSKNLRFTIELRWNKFLGTADTSVALPRTKKVTVEVKDIVMTVEDVPVIKK